MILRSGLALDERLRAAARVVGNWVPLMVSADDRMAVGCRAVDDVVRHERRPGGYGEIIETPTFSGRCSTRSDEPQHHCVAGMNRSCRGGFRAKDVSPTLEAMIEAPAPCLARTSVGIPRSSSPRAHRFVYVVLQRDGWTTGPSRSFSWSPS